MARGTEVVGTGEGSLEEERAARAKWWAQVAGQVIAAALVAGGGWLGGNRQGVSEGEVAEAGRRPPASVVAYLGRILTELSEENEALRRQLATLQAQIERESAPIAPPPEPPRILAPEETSP